MLPAINFNRTIDTGVGGPRRYNVIKVTLDGPLERKCRFRGKASMIVEERRAQLKTKVDTLVQHKDRDWAVANFLPTVRDLIEMTQATTVLEVGGGRAPYLDKATIDRLGLRYTCNDISAHELSLAPDWVDTALFDIQTPDKSEIAPYLNKYDFAFSKWVMEHVADYQRAYTNIYDILSDGGIYIAYHPLQYAAPFVLNQMIPEKLSAPLLRAIFPNRNDDDTPKFPAHYSGCRISQTVRDNIRAIGFSQVWQMPFYGHAYYSKFPVIRDIHKMVTRQLRDADVSLLAAFAYTIVQK